MKAMVLAAGKGTRLFPLTGEMLKPLAPVANRPIIEHIFGLLERSGFEEAHVNANYLGKQLVSLYGGMSGSGRGFGGLGVTVLLEPDLSGTAGGVRRLAEAAASRASRGSRDPRDAFGETFAVVMGDALTDMDLSAVVEYHRQKGSLATMALVPVEDTLGYGVVQIDASGNVVGFQEKPDPSEARSNLANTGIYVFEPGIFDYVRPGTFSDFARDVFPRLLEAGERFAAFDAGPLGSYWSDIGTLDAYRQAQRDALSGRVRVELVETPWGDGRLRIGRRARVHAASYARINGPTVIGDDVEIGCVRRISGEVAIGNGCRVEDGVVLERSVLLPGARVGSNAHLVDCVVGPGHEVRSGERVRGEVLVRPPRALEDGASQDLARRPDGVFADPVATAV